jgi:hypothetical protein
VLAGSEDRVEQQLTVLAARVALAEAGVAGEDVVAIGARVAGERTVIEAEQADDAMRHRTHRHHRAHREVAGAEVRAGGAAGEPVGEQRVDFAQGERRRGCLAGGF